VRQFACVRLNCTLTLGTQQPDLPVRNGDACGFHDGFQGQGKVYVNQTLLDLWHWIKLTYRVPVSYPQKRGVVVQPETLAPSDRWPTKLAMSGVLADSLPDVVFRKSEFRKYRLCRRFVADLLAITEEHPNHNRSAEPWDSPATAYRCAIPMAPG
jgi:hypothetical protein